MLGKRGKVSFSFGSWTGLNTGENMSTGSNSHSSCIEFRPFIVPCLLLHALAVSLQRMWCLFWVYNGLRESHIFSCFYNSQNWFWNFLSKTALFAQLAVLNFYQRGSSLGVSYLYLQLTFTKLKSCPPILNPPFCEFSSFLLVALSCAWDLPPSASIQSASNATHPPLHSY